MQKQKGLAYSIFVVKKSGLDKGVKQIVRDLFMGGPHQELVSTITNELEPRERGLVKRALGATEIILSLNIDRKSSPVWLWQQNESFWEANYGYQSSGFHYDILMNTVINKPFSLCIIRAQMPQDKLDKAMKRIKGLSAFVETVFKKNGERVRTEHKLIWGGYGIRGLFAFEAKIMERDEILQAAQSFSRKHKKAVAEHMEKFPGPYFYNTQPDMVREVMHNFLSRQEKLNVTATDIHATDNIKQTFNALLALLNPKISESEIVRLGEQFATNPETAVHRLVLHLEQEATAPA